MNRAVLSIALALFGACSLAADDERTSRGQIAIQLCVEQYVKVTGNPVPDFVDRAYIDAGEDAMELALTRGEVGTFGIRDRDYMVVTACRVELKPEPQLSRWVVNYPSWSSSGPVDYQGLYDEDLEEMLYLRDDDRFVFEASHPFSEERIDAIEFPERQVEQKREPPIHAAVRCLAGLLGDAFFSCEQVERGELEVQVSVDESRPYISVQIRERAMDMLEGGRLARCELDAFTLWQGWEYLSSNSSREVIQIAPVSWGPVPYNPSDPIWVKGEEALKLYEQYFGDWPSGREVAEVKDLSRLERLCRNPD